MKTFVLILLTFTCFAQINAQISEKERQDALAYYDESFKNLQAQTAGLTNAQLNWKPNDTTWSIANCLEHITLTEKGIFDWAMGTLKEPANPSKKNELKNTDEMVKTMVTSREHKAKAPKEITPTGKLGDAKKTFETFNKQRTDIVNYIKNSKDDLRNHFAQTPIGLVDTYQMLLFLNAHTKRHTAQIAEVKATSGFPQ